MSQELKTAGDSLVDYVEFEKHPSNYMGCIMDSVQPGFHVFSPYDSP